MRRPSVARPIFWDEPTWVVRDHGAIWSCRCDRCQQGFRDRFGGPMPVEYTDEVKRFLQESMADLLSEACLHARSRGLRNAVCVMPWEWSNPGFTDWDLAASIKGLDNFGADPYWGKHDEAADYVATWTRRIVETAAAPRPRPPCLDPGVPDRRGPRAGDRGRDRRRGGRRRAQPGRLVLRRLRGDVDVRVRRPDGRVGHGPDRVPPGARRGMTAGLPAGLTARDYAPADAPEIVELWRRAIGDRYPLTLEVFRQCLDRNPSFRPADAVVVVADDGARSSGSPISDATGSTTRARSTGVARHGCRP